MRYQEFDHLEESIRLVFQKMITQNPIKINRLPIVILASQAGIVWQDPEKRVLS